LAEAGYDVAVLDPLASDIAQAIEDKGAASTHLEVDISDEAQVIDAAAEIESRMGRRPRVLVNNAGIYPRGDALEIDFDTWMLTLRVNLAGTFLCARTFARGMFAEGEGRIVNIASGRAFAGAVKGSNYAA